MLIPASGYGFAFPNLTRNAPVTAENNRAIMSVSAGVFLFMSTQSLFVSANFLNNIGLFLLLKRFYQGFLTNLFFLSQDFLTNSLALLALHQACGFKVFTSNLYTKIPLL